MQSLDQTALILGALTATGGTVGFIKTGSMPSIAAGLTVGALVCRALAIQTKKKALVLLAINYHSWTER